MLNDPLFVCNHLPVGIFFLIVDHARMYQAGCDLSPDFMQQVRRTDGRRVDSFSDYLPGMLFSLLNKYISHRQRKKQSLLANISISNVPGPKGQLLACDGRLKMVDLLSCGNLMDINAMGVTVWSYVDNLCFNLLFRKNVLKSQYRVKEILSDVILELEGEL